MQNRVVLLADRVSTVVAGRTIPVLPTAAAQCSNAAIPASRHCEPRSFTSAHPQLYLLLCEHLVGQRRESPVSILIGDNDGDNFLTLTITDGGFGDADLTVNGEIVDPGGPATSTSPIANDDTENTYVNIPITFNVTANDADPQNDALTVTSITSATNGTAINNGDGTITYTPDAGKLGLDTFNYTLSDGNETSTAVVNVTVNHVTFQLSFGSIGSGDGQFGANLGGAAINNSGVVFVADRDNHRIQAFDQSGNFRCARRARVVGSKRLCPTARKATCRTGLRGICRRHVR